MPVRYLALIGLLISSPVYAYVNPVCAERVSKECFAEEKDKPDSTRNGMSAAEYCAAVAVVECDQ